MVFFTDFQLIPVRRLCKAMKLPQKSLCCHAMKWSDRVILRAYVIDLSIISLFIECDSNNVQQILPHTVGLFILNFFSFKSDGFFKLDKTRNTMSCLLRRFLIKSIWIEDKKFNYMPFTENINFNKVSKCLLFPVLVPTAPSLCRYLNSWFSF